MAIFAFTKYFSPKTESKLSAQKLATTVLPFFIEPILAPLAPIAIPNCPKKRIGDPF